MRLAGNLGQPNQTATLLLMGMATLAWAYERGPTGGWAWRLCRFRWRWRWPQRSRARVRWCGGGRRLCRTQPFARFAPAPPAHRAGLPLACVVVVLPGLSDLLLMSGPRSFEVGVDGPR